MRKLFLVLGLATLTFSLGCGSSSSGPTPQGNFSNASFSGPYAYQLSGFDLNTGNPYSRAGVLTADGNGGITAGTDDLTEGSLVSSGIVSGTYSVSNDGTGTIALTLGSGSTVQWAITIQSSSKVYIVETSTTPSGTLTPFTGYGVAELQNSAAFVAPTGTFAFKCHAEAIGGTSISPNSAVGAIALSGGVGTGAEDVNILGSGLVPNATVTNAVFNPPDSFGRGTASITESVFGTTTFVYYVVDANNLRTLISSPGTIGLGRYELQSGTFSNATFAGNYAFGSRGDTANNLLGAHTVGVFSADGAGNISSFNFDAMRDGTLTSNGNFSGNTYAVASNGRVAVALNSGAATQVYWLVNNTRAFFLASDPTSAVDGTADLQNGSGFSNSSVNGQFAFLNDGVQLGGNPLGIVNFYDRVATLQFNGSGGLTFNEFINVSGNASTPGFLSGSYSTSSNGRMTGKINGSGNNVNLVFYLVSGQQAYMLQTDADFEVDGMMQLQQ